jgi:hypothetical protein
MKRNIVRLFTVMFAAMTVLVLSSETSAQRRVVVVKPKPKTVVVTKPAKTVVVKPIAYNKVVVDDIIKRVEERVDRFVDQFDAGLDRSALDGSDREDWLNKRAKDLEVATDELRREYDRRDTWQENKNEVRKCLNIATDINKTMIGRKMGPATEANWANVRAELNALAKAYGLPAVGSAVYK